LFGFFEIEVLVNSWYFTRAWFTNPSHACHRMEWLGHSNVFLQPGNWKYGHRKHVRKS